MLTPIPSPTSSHVPISKNLGALLQGIGSDVSRRSNELLRMEENDTGVAYIKLLRSQQKNGASSSLAQETSSLYDKIFYVANSIAADSDNGRVDLVISSQNFVRLNDKVPVNGVWTVNELRNQEKPGMLFSGVAAIQIKSQDGNRIPLLQRDAGAPTEAGKYTLPAGRADKTPGLTAYEGLLEELVVFGVKDGLLVQIVPFLEDGGISIEKANLLASIAKGRYIQSLIKKGHSDLDSDYISRLVASTMIIETLGIHEGGVDVKTAFSDTPDSSVVEGGFFLVNDSMANTIEFVRGFHLDLSQYESLYVGDGDGFGRDTKLFSIPELESIESDKMVASLRGVIDQGVFQE